MVNDTLIQMLLDLSCRPSNVLENPLVMKDSTKQEFQSANERLNMFDWEGSLDPKMHSVHKNLMCGPGIGVWPRSLCMMDWA